MTIESGPVWLDVDIIWELPHCHRFLYLIQKNRHLSVASMQLAKQPSLDRC